jgi:hypothetical protein
MNAQAKSAKARHFLLFVDLTREPNTWRSLCELGALAVRSATSPALAHVFQRLGLRFDDGFDARGVTCVEHAPEASHHALPE